MGEMEAPMILGNIHADGHSANSLFALENTVHKHYPTDITRSLRDALLAQGLEVNTPDVNAGQPVAFDLHLEGRPLPASDRPRFLIALENPHINPLNADKDYCAQFDLVFAWDQRLMDLPHVVPLMVPHALQTPPFASWEERDIFSCLINANKAFRAPEPGDLYLERLQTIRWHEKNALSDFQLYGMGWHKAPPAYTPWGKLVRAGAMAWSKLKNQPAFPSYHGEVQLKSDVLVRAKFSYTYENSSDLPNYITEKIFDSMVCGCVPVYWGAGNIEQWIPEDCFIDRRKFADTSDVHRYLHTIDQDRFARYQTAMADFLAGPQADAFRLSVISRKIAEQIARSLNPAAL